MRRARFVVVVDMTAINNGSHVFVLNFPDADAACVDSRPRCILSCHEPVDLGTGTGHAVTGHDRHW